MKGIIESFWFKSVKGQELSINTPRSVQVLDKLLKKLGQQKLIRMTLQWFQKDGVIPNTSAESLQ